MKLSELFTPKLKKIVKVKRVSKENADRQGGPTIAKRGWGSEPWIASTDNVGGIKS
jgi:hypothetical protein